MTDQKVVSRRGRRPNKGHALTQNASYRSALGHVDFFNVVNRDPGRVYRFVSRKLLDRNAGQDLRGWIPLNASNSKGECIADQFGKGLPSHEGGVSVDDLVLAFMPKEQGDLKRLAIQQATIARRRATIEQLKALGRSVGIQPKIDLEVSGPAYRAEQER